LGRSEPAANEAAGAVAQNHSGRREADNRKTEILFAISRAGQQVRGRAEACN
jgi:hypothetical protein